MAANLPALACTGGDDKDRQGWGGMVYLSFILDGAAR